MFVLVLTLILLGCCWAVGDMEFRTKALLTLLYAASWALVLVGGFAVIVAQALLSIVLGYMTFGAEFLSRRRH